MKKNVIYSLFILLSITLFTSCEDDERAQYVDKNMLVGAKWFDYWEDDKRYYDQMFIFNKNGIGYEIYTENDYAEVHDFDWEWKGYKLIIYRWDGEIYEWDVLELSRDILTIVWDREEITFFTYN